MFYEGTIGQDVTGCHEGMTEKGRYNKQIIQCLSWILRFEGGTSAMKTGPAFRPHARFCLNSMLVAGSICKMNMNHLLSMLLRGAFLGLSSGFLGITASCATFVMKERSCEPDALSTTQSCGKGLGEAVWNSHEACNEGSCEICLPKGVRYCWWPSHSLLA